MCGCTLFSRNNTYTCWKFLLTLNIIFLITHLKKWLIKIILLLNMFAYYALAQLYPSLIRVLFTTQLMGSLVLFVPIQNNRPDIEYRAQSRRERSVFRTVCFSSQHGARMYWSLKLGLEHNHYQIKQQRSQNRSTAQRTSEDHGLGNHTQAQVTLHSWALTTSRGRGSLSVTLTVTFSHTVRRIYQ